MPGLRFQLPLFVFLFKDSPGAEILSNGKILFIAMFTSLEYAKLYRRRAKMESQIVAIQTVEQLASFVEFPPSQDPSLNYYVLFDPIDVDDSRVAGYSKADFLAGLRS